MIARVSACRDPRFSIGILVNIRELLVNLKSVTIHSTQIGFFK